MQPSLVHREFKSCPEHKVPGMQGAANCHGCFEATKGKLITGPRSLDLHVERGRPVLWLGPGPLTLKAIPLAELGGPCLPPHGPWRVPKSFQGTKPYAHSALPLHGGVEATIGGPMIGSSRSGLHQEQGRSGRRLGLGRLLLRGGAFLRSCNLGPGPQGPRYTSTAGDGGRAPPGRRSQHHVV